MDLYDFTRSFLTFTAHERSNIARIMIDARCTLTGSDGSAREFVLIAPCRSEVMYVEEGLLQQPNYEFCGVFGRDEFNIIRTRASCEGEKPDPGAVADRFDNVTIDIALHENVRPLPDGAAIVEATLANLPLIGRTTLDCEGGRALIEYPVKTMNVRPEGNLFQVDTGPLPFPEAIPAAGREVEQFRFSHVVYNRFDYAEFIVLDATPIGGGQSVSHYSRIEPRRVTNELFCAEA